MKKFLSLTRVQLICLALILPLLFAVSRATAETNGGGPTIMVEQDAHDYTVGAYRIVYRTASFCDEPPGLADAPTTPEDPELISRIFTFGSSVRVLLEKNDPRPPQECNPYHIYSNILADGQYVYWADDTGLVRQSVFANAGDEPELVNATVLSTHNEQKVELAQTDDYIYALFYPTAITGKIIRIDKATLTATPTYSMLGFGSQFAADEEYVYWTFTGNLFRAKYVSGTNWDDAQIASDVSSFASEGLKTVCNPTCITTHYVFIAKTNTVVRYNNMNGITSSAIYTSSSPDDPNIYNMLADGTNLFFLESRANLPCPGCFFEYTQVLFRLPRLGGTAAPLYTHVSELTGYLDVNHLAQDTDFIYWQQDDTVQKLPKDAAALPQTNMSIARIEVTQGIQDINNDVPLIEERRTFVRVYAQSEGPSVLNVTTFLYRVDPVTLLPIGSPLAPVNPSGTHIWVAPDSDPSILDSSFLFELPLSWLQEGTPLRLKAVLNPYNTPLESNPNDNTTYSETFVPVHSSRLEAEFYAFIYTDANNLTRSPRHIKDIDQTFSYIRRTYPLASTPGSGNDSSAGFRPNVHWVSFDKLEGLLMGTDEYCDDFSAEDLNSCAATYVNDMLQGWQSNDEDADGTAYIYYGWMPDASGFGRGKGKIEEGVASGPTGVTCCGSGAWDTDGAYTDWYTAHELGHAIGRLHPSQGNWCGHSDDDDDFPYMDTAIGPYAGFGIDLGEMWGFDGGDPSLALPKLPLPSSIWRDLMGYCDFQWVSDYTYMGLYADLPQWEDGVANLAPLRSPQSEMLSIYGTLLTNANIAKLTFIQRGNLNAAPPIVPGDFAIRLLNAQNQTLANHPFTPDAAEDGSYLRSFGQAVPFVNGTTHVQIVELATNSVWADQPISANAPVVSNVNLVADTNPITGTVTVNWTAIDADGDALTYDVLFSQDGGNTFLPYLIGVTTNSTPADTNLLGGGSTIFQVIASDGVNTGSANSAPFTLANKPPMPRIHNPGDGAVVMWGQLINFIGEAPDYQDGSVAAANLAWSNQYGPLGTGATLEVTDLPVGENQITLTATNSKGLSASKTITVIVQDDLQTPAATLQVGPSPIGWHVAPGETALQTTILHLINAGAGSLTWTATDDADWLTLDITNGSAPETLTVTANPTGLTPDTSYTATITFTADNGDGSPQILTIPVTLTLGEVWFEPPPVAQTKIYLPTITR